MIILAAALVRARFGDRQGKITPLDDVARTGKMYRGAGKYHLDYPNGMNAGPSWSQYGQDHWIDTHTSHGKSPFFVEVGGYDGEKFSNTLFLEKHRGWDGLLIEANPYTFDILRSRDRKCWAANACLSDTVPDMTFIISGSTTSATKTMTDKFRARVKNDVATYGTSGDKRWVHAGEKVTTQCRSLASMMAEIGRNHIDYFSLDVEGAEMFILKSIPFDSITISVFTIELDQHSTEIVAFMESKGYSLVHRLSGDGVFKKVKKQVE